MAINYATIFNKSLDKDMGALPLTNVLLAKNVKYNGGGKIAIPVVNGPGSKNYNKQSGYAESAASIDWVEYTLPHDRDISVRIDSMDYDETNFALDVTSVLHKQMEITAAEIDCSRIASICAGANQGCTIAGEVLTKSNVVEKIAEGIAAVRDKSTSVEDPIIFVDTNTLSLLKQANYTLEKGQFVNGEVVMEVSKFDGCMLIPLQSARMKSAYTIDNTGCKPAVGAKSINFIVIAQDIALAIVKRNDLKVIDAAVNTAADAYDIKGRIYHGCIVLEQHSNLIHISQKDA